MKMLTPEQHNYLASIVKGRTAVECTDMLNKKFNLNLQVGQIRGYKKRYKLPSGLDCRFKKGQKARNKGQKMSDDIRDKVKGTWFKKGQVPHNHVPVGTEVVDSEGYIKVKVAEPNIWRHKHRLVWECHYGEIPKGKMISFINGEKNDCNIDNLIMIDNQINGVLNHNLKIRERPPELVTVISDILQIKNKLKELIRD